MPLHGARAFGPWVFLSDGALGTSGGSWGPNFYPRGSSETRASGRQVEILGPIARRRYCLTWAQALDVLGLPHD